MRYIAIIPAVGLVVAFAIVLIGNPFSADNHGDSAAPTPPVLSIAGTPADVPAPGATQFDEASEPAPADDARIAAEEVAFETTAAANDSDAAADTLPGGRVDAVAHSRIIGEESGAAEFSDAEDICQPGVQRHRRPGRRFGRCR